MPSRSVVGSSGPLKTGRNLATGSARVHRALAGVVVVLVGWLCAWCYEPYACDGPVLCLWRRVFGVQCPGCGMTRAVCSLAHGHVATAVAFNPLVVLVVALPVLVWGRDWRSTLSYTSPQRLRRNHSTPNTPTNARKNGQVSQ